jgi:Nucleotidyl transferase AbiEii toxin, Type IV TA system
VISFAAAFEELLAALDRLEIAFLVGGSVASGTHGVPRFTKDIDIVADLKRDKVGELCDALLPVFYVDDDAVEQAIDRGRSFNVIHTKGAYKFDIFPIGRDPFARSQLARRRYTTTRIPGLENIEFPVASPEDTILSKLVWFRKGGEVSDQQWHDVLGMIQIQAGLLDRAYLQHWAAQLGVSDLLAKVLV